MKRRIILSIALVLSIVFVSLTSSDRAVNAEPPQRFKVDTGVITLGANQILRVTTVSGQGSGDPIPVEIITLNYMETACSGAICKQAVSSQTTSARLLLAPNEAASMDITQASNSSGVRAVIVSNSRAMRVNIVIIDAATGKIITLSASDGSGIPLI